MTAIFDSIEGRNGIEHLSSVIEGVPDINIHRSTDDKTPLHLAVHTNQLDMCSLLLSCGANINMMSCAQDGTQDGPLHIASAVHVCVDIFKLLITHEAIVNVQSLPKGLTPLHKVVNLKWIDSIQQSNDVCNETYGGTWSMKESDDIRSKMVCQYEKLKILLNHGADVNQPTFKHKASLKLLVGGPGTGGKCEGVSSIAVDMLILLIRHGADVNDITSGFTPLQEACAKQQMHFITPLLKNGANINKVHWEHGQTLLHLILVYAYEDSDVEHIKEGLQILVNHGLDINTASTYGHTILHLACALGTSIDVIEAILELGINIESPDMCGRTALFNCTQVEEEHIDTICLLAKHGVDVNQIDNNGCTALVEAVIRNEPTSVKILLENGASVNVQDKCHRTALHHFILSSWESESSDDISDYTEDPKVLIVQLLVEHKSDTKVRDKFGKVAMDYMSLIEDGITKQTVKQVLESISLESCTLFDNKLWFMYIATKRNCETYLDMSSRDDVSCLLSMKVTENTDLDCLVTDILNTPGLGIAEGVEYFRSINNQVHLMVTSLACELSKNMHGLFYKPIISGSVSEGTKVGFPNEFDFLFLIEEFEDIFEPDDIAQTPGHITLKLKDSDKYPDSYKAFVDSDTYFVGSQFRSYFEDAVMQAMRRVNVWQNTDLYHTFFFKSHSSHANPANVYIHMTAPLPHFGNIDISVDLVPVMRLPENWWPKGGVDRNNVVIGPTTGRLCVALMKTAIDVETESGDREMRISASQIETVIMRTLPEYMRQTFILLKAVFCLVYDTDIEMEAIKINEYISTYALKTVLLRKAIQSGVRKRLSEPSIINSSGLKLSELLDTHEPSGLQPPEQLDTHDPSVLKPPEQLDTHYPSGQKPPELLDTHDSSGLKPPEQLDTHAPSGLKPPEQLDTHDPSGLKLPEQLDTHDPLGLKPPEQLDAHDKQNIQIQKLILSFSQSCLQDLKDCIEDGFMPSFFFEEMNVFSHFKFGHYRPKMVQTLNHVMNKLHTN